MIEVLNTATFTDRGDTTELALHAIVINAAPEMSGALAGMEEGWLQSFEKLDGLLTGREIDTSSREALATRLLDAPRETVWRAWTDPERGPLALHGTGGADNPATITFLAVQEPAVLAYLSGDPSQPGHAFTTVEFSDEGGKTAVTVRMHFASAEERTRMVEENSALQELEASLDELATNLTREARP
jgi:uncharacterized protein YndB with AHSA1/START domain